MDRRRVKVLDCTLRDGGYINDWNFSIDEVRNIVSGLEKANIDIIEVGFLDNTSNGIGTKFKKMDDIKSSVRDRENSNSKIVGMIMLGRFSKDDLCHKDESVLDGIRVCFKKNQLEEALQLSKAVIEKGYDLYIQPASVGDYGKNDVKRMIESFNELKPKAIYIVDTYGLMIKDDVVKYCMYFDAFMDDDIELGFHSHNNLQLSFSNSQEVLNSVKHRDVIIDSSVFGMGRGAGNLCTELITRYLNNQYGMDYHLLPLMEIIDLYINNYFKEYYWGYSVPYYVAAMTKSHPNYATYLVNKHSLSVNTIYSLLNLLPEDKRRNYDEELIKQMYLEYQQKEVDDESVIKVLQEKIKDKKIVLVAPGKTISTHRNQIVEMVERNDVFCILLNSMPEGIKGDLVFVSNLNRMTELKGKGLRKLDVIATSNIENLSGIEEMVVNYNSLVDTRYKVGDAAGVMAIRMLIRAGVKMVYLAGFDGFMTNGKESYYDSRLGYSIDAEENSERNKEYKRIINELKSQIEMKFLTPSILDI